MTQTVKRYIDLDDLEAFVFECKHCKATLSLRLAAAAFNVPQVCPSCQAQWYERMTDGRNIATVIDQLLTEMNILRRALASEGFKRPGFTLKVEVEGLLSAPLLPPAMFS